MGYTLSIPQPVSSLLAISAVPTLTNLSQTFTLLKGQLLPANGT